MKPISHFSYDRPVVGFHGTRKATATKLVHGEPFGPSTNDDDWLGHGIYFWEYAPQKAWQWAEHRYGANNAAVVGANIRLGRCFDLLDPANSDILVEAETDLARTMKTLGQPLPSNANASKFRDCAVFNYMCDRWAESHGVIFDSIRAVFVPLAAGRFPRLWKRSGVFRGAHIQLCLRNPTNIMAAWYVKRDGRYGKEP